MNTDKRLEPADDLSESSGDKIILVPNISMEDLHFDSKQIHFRARSVLEGRTPKEQKEIAADMFSQMKQLQAHNEVMGYHGFSALLQRHDSNMNITGYNNNDKEDDKDDKDDNDDNENNNYDNDSTYSDIDSVISVYKKTRSRNEKSGNVILSETQSLRTKLETISMSINKMLQDLENENGNNNYNYISAEQLNQTIIFFQNRLTAIQDQIEDAEHVVESHIDITFLKYIQEIKINKEKIKNMEKERKEKEKQLQINKDKEQKNIIQIQRLQIEQLIRTQSPRPTMETVIEKDNEINFSNTNTNTNTNTDDDDDDIYNYIQIPLNSMQTMQTMQTMQYSPISPISMSEGQYQSTMLQTQRQQPLVSDNAIKIIGGVVIMLSGVWIISKYIDGGVRAPRFNKY